MSDRIRAAAEISVCRFHPLTASLVVYSAMNGPALPGHNNKQAVKLVLTKETDKMNNPEIIEARLASLRRAMTEDGVDYYLMTSSDPHASEYVSDHFKTTEYFSG